MKCLLSLGLLIITNQVLANRWSYQVNINGDEGKVNIIGPARAFFEAGPYKCEVTPIIESQNTQYRSLVCQAGAGTISTGGLCTKKSAKFSSVQYAILNLNSPRNFINVVVACEFD